MGMLSQSRRCSFHPLLNEASPMATIGPLHDDDPSLQAHGLVVFSFMPSVANSAPLDASSCTAGLATCYYEGCMACQALCSRIELSGVLLINVVPSVAWTQFGSLCCIPTSKALVPLVDSFLVDTPRRASAGPRSRSCVQRVRRSLRIADVDHMGMLMASNAEHHVGLGPPTPFINIPSECHCSALHDRRARPRPSLPSSKPGPLGGASINEESYLVDLASSHMLVSKIKLCMCKYEPR
nr:hypothetical protein CFP56_53400 [Quercus suber]